MLLAARLRFLRTGIWWHTISGTAASMVIGASALLAAALTAHELGLAGRGVIAVVTSWSLLLISLSNPSFGEVAVHIISRTGREDRQVGSLVGTLFVLSACTSAISFAAFLALYLVGGKTLFASVPLQLLVLTVFGIPFTILVSNLKSVYQVLGEIPRYSLVTAATAATTAVGLAVAYAFHAITLPLFFWLGFMLNGIGCILLVPGRRHVDPSLVRFDPQLARGLLRGAVRLHGTILLGFFANTFDILILNHYRPVDEIGLYQFSLAIVAVFLFVPNALAGAFYSRIAKVGVRDSLQVQMRFTTGVAAVTLVVAALAYAFAPAVLALLGGAQFSAHPEYLRILLLGTVPLAVAKSMTPQAMGHGAFLAMSLIVMAGTLLDLIINFLTIPRFGAIAAAWANVLNSYLLTIALVILIHRLNRAPAVPS